MRMILNSSNASKLIVVQNLMSDNTTQNTLIMLHSLKKRHYIFSKKIQFYRALIYPKLFVPPGGIE